MWYPLHLESFAKFKLRSVLLFRIATVLSSLLEMLACRSLYPAGLKNEAKLSEAVS